MKSSESDRQEDAQQQQRLQTLQDFYTAEDVYIKAGGGDFSAIARTLDPDCVVRHRSRYGMVACGGGHAGVEAWMKEFAQQWAVLEVENSQTFVQGDFIPCLLLLLTGKSASLASTDCCASILR